MTCEKMNTVKRLEDWFFIHCDNDWEHSNRIEIYNLDNPGWGVKIDLEETLLEEIQFDKVEYGDSEDRTATWLKCYKEEKIFIGLGSYNMLEIILQRFLDWAEFNTYYAGETGVLVHNSCKHNSKWNAGRKRYWKGEAKA